MKNTVTMGLLLLAVIFSLSQQVAQAQQQTTPAVKVFALVGQSDTRQRYKQANGVIVGHDKQSGAGWVLTAAHTFEATDESTKPLIEYSGSTYQGRIEHVSLQNDLVMIRFDHNFSQLPVANLRLTTLALNERVSYCGYIPPTWRYGCVPGIRKRNQVIKWYTVAMNGQSGMSGGGVYDMQGNLIGILSRGNPAGTVSEVVPNFIIAQLYAKWKDRTAPAKQQQDPEDQEQHPNFNAPDHKLQPESEPVKAQPETEEKQPESTAELLINQADLQTEQQEAEQEGLAPWAKSNWISLLGLACGGIALTGMSWHTLAARAARKAVQRSREARYQHAPPVMLEHPPPPQNIEHKVHFTPYETDETAEAFAWAKSEYGRKYPGSIGTVEAVESLMDQYKSGQRAKGK